MRAQNAADARWNKEKKKKDDEAIDAAGQLIVCDQDFGTAVERMVTLAISSPVWDTILEMILGQEGMKYSLDSLVESSMACMSQSQKGNLESYSNLVALSPSISKQCKLHERCCTTCLQYIFPVFNTIFTCDTNIGVIGVRTIQMNMFLENVKGLWIAKQEMYAVALWGIRHES